MGNSKTKREHINRYGTILTNNSVISEYSCSFIYQLDDEPEWSKHVVKPL